MNVRARFSLKATGEILVIRWRRGVAVLEFVCWCTADPHLHCAARYVFMAGIAAISPFEPHGWSTQFLKDAVRLSSQACRQSFATFFRASQLDGKYHVL
jgi:hypothetical protein